jgi:nucleoid-associated protein YgaU
VQNVPPPVVPPVVEQTANGRRQTAAEVVEVVDVSPPVAPPVAPEYRLNEGVPAIPKDSLVAAPGGECPPLLAPVPVQESAPPLDWQLWEQVRELRGETEPEPTAETGEQPALRFKPKPSYKDDNLLMTEAVNQFRGLTFTDELSPNSNAIDMALPALENAPQPVFAEIQPKYRDEQTSSEQGMTFQSRIDSEISRSPSATETYIVQQGDTYMTISDKFYGTSLLYNALGQHNKKLGIGWQPAAGVVIEVPTAEYLRANFREAANRQERRLESQSTAIKYVVQEGDTIFRLATDKLRDSTRWREIHALNMDRIQDVRDLQPGMEIFLPGK